MSSLPLSNLTTDWLSRVEDDGVLTFNTEGTTVTLSSGANTGRAYIRKFIPLNGGEYITLRFMARKISGVVEAGIDYPFEGANYLRNRTTIDSTEWQEYTLTAATSNTHNPVDEYVSVNIGTFSTVAGAGEFANVRIEVSGGAKGPSNTWASGLFRFRQEGTDPAFVEINDNFHTNGISNVEWDAITPTELNVTIPVVKTTGNYRLRPLFFAQLTSEYLPDVVAKVGEYDPATGIVKIKFANGTGSFVDIRSLLVTGNSIFMSFMATGI